MDQSLTELQETVEHQHGVQELGPASSLFECSTALFSSLLRSLAEDIEQLGPDLYGVLRNEFRKFYLWNDGLSTRSGELDDILSHSKNLKATVLPLIALWARAVCRRK
jgi:hypothetical protein